MLRRPQATLWHEASILHKWLSGARSRKSTLSGAMPNRCALMNKARVDFEGPLPREALVAVALAPAELQRETVQA